MCLWASVLCIFLVHHHCAYANAGLVCAGIYCITAKYLLQEKCFGQKLYRKIKYLLCSIRSFLNLLNPTCYVMHQQV
jgi:hypothetical protein